MRKLLPILISIGIASLWHGHGTKELATAWRGNTTLMTQATQGELNNTASFAPPVKPVETPKPDPAPVDDTETPPTETPVETPVVETPSNPNVGAPNQPWISN